MRAAWYASVSVCVYACVRRCVCAYGGRLYVQEHGCVAHIEDLTPHTHTQTYTHTHTHTRMPLCFGHGPQREGPCVHVQEPGQEVVHRYTPSSFTGKTTHASRRLINTRGNRAATCAQHKREQSGNHARSRVSPQTPEPKRERTRTYQTKTLKRSQNFEEAEGRKGAEDCSIGSANNPNNNPSHLVSRDPQLSLEQDLRTDLVCHWHATAEQCRRMFCAALSFRDTSDKRKLAT